MFCDDNILSQVNPSLRLQSQAPSAFDGWPWVVIDVPASQTNTSTAREDESGLYTCSRTTSHGLQAYPAVQSHLVIPGGGMTPSSSSWHPLTPPSRPSTDINSDGYQEVSLLAAAPGVDFQFCSPEDPCGDLLGLKSDRPTRNCSNESPHLKGRKRSIVHREVKIAAMPASSTKQTLSVKPTKGKRKSPLSKEGRRNADAVRKNGGQCIRCRLYKAKVFLVLFLLHCLPLTKASVTQAILVKNALINLKPQSYFASHAIVTT
jgi:hypothetical protein